MAKSKKSRALTTATGVSTLANVYYDRPFLANLKANTSMSAFWGCSCGQPATHEETVTTKISRVFKRQKQSRQFPLCDGCHFRYQVMKAAGRIKEFIAAYDEQRKDRLPARSGKTIQMYNYKPVTKP
jgi:hypothetical protein